MTEETCEILLFQVGPRVFASVVHDAVRIGSVREVPAGTLVVGSALGMPWERLRGVVVDVDGVERTVVVDRVLGVRAVPEGAVAPLPAFAAACVSSGAVTGFVLLDDSPVLLVDLPTLVRDCRGAAPEPRAA